MSFRAEYTLLQSHQMGQNPVPVSTCLLAFPGCYNITLFGFLSKSIPYFTLVYLLKALHLLNQFRLSNFFCMIFSHSKNLVLAFSFFFLSSFHFHYHLQGATITELQRRQILDADNLDLEHASRY